MKKISMLVFCCIQLLFAKSQADMNSQWTWVKGDSMTRQYGIYGTIGVPANANKPGGRQYATNWVDSSGNLWLFGGAGRGANGNGGLLNDLWKYNPANNQWTWIKGSSSINQYGNYGVRGVASATNEPGARRFSTAWEDNEGKFWLFGGLGYSASGSSNWLNDLWKYDPVSNQWTWVKGDSITDVSGIYGTQGIAAASNKPGSREGSISWKDVNGNLWLLGGRGRLMVNFSGTLNDLWKYNPVSNQWTWVNGDKAVNQNGIYGTQGFANAANKPGSRLAGHTWRDNDGNLWLFGGYGYDAPGMFDTELNDLWKYNPLNNQWAWMKGSNTGNQFSVYGVRGIASPSNTPGGRDAGAAWQDKSGNFWLWGGYGYDPVDIPFKNDLWVYNVSDNQWTWIGGDSTLGEYGNYGEINIQKPDNKPGVRFTGAFWADTSKNFWIFGGGGLASSGPWGNLSDMWKLSPAVAQTVIQLCPGADSTLSSAAIGSTYQWQLSIDSVNFTNISDNSNYLGSNSANLQMSNIPPAWYGYRYRCLVNGVSGNVYTLVFVTNWTGSANADWGNPLNWSCGIIPDANTDAIINSGTVLVNSNGTCRTLQTSPGVIFTVSSGYNLIISH